MNTLPSTLPSKTQGLDLRSLEVLQVLLHELHVSRAALRLGISQPAASRWLARLRIIFGDPLLLRSQSGMVLTERAIEISDALPAILEGLNKVLAPTKRFDPKISRRRFVLTAPDYAEHLLLPPLVKQLRQQAPHISLDVRPPDASRAMEHLERGEVDLRIAWLLDPPASLRSMPLWQDRIVCILDRHHPRVRGSLSLAQYLGMAHARPLGWGRTTTSRVIDAAVEREGAKLGLTLGVQNMLTLPQILSGSDLVGTVPQMLARSFAAQYPLQLLELPLQLPKVRYASYWHERSHKDPAHRWLRQMVLSAARTLHADSRVA